MQQIKLKLSFLFLFGFTLTGLRAQEAVPATGGNASGSGGTSSYSVGQVVFNMKTGIDGSLAEGVQQPFEIFVITGIEDGIGITLECSVYPNPTSDFLNLNIKGNLNSHFSASLYDINGKLLKNIIVENLLTSIDMKNLVSSTYFLKVIQTGQVVSQEIKPSKSLKINTL